MIKNITALEVAKANRAYKLLLDNDSPLGELFDVLNEMRGLVVAEINKHAPPAPVPTDQPAPVEAQVAPEQPQA